MTANGTSGSMTDLDTLGGTLSIASAINNHGQIVGIYVIAAGDADSHDFVWQNGVMYDLDALLPANSGWVMQSYSNDINDNYQITGTGLYNGQKRAFLISDPDGNFANGVATITNLGTLGGASSEGYGINSSGQVVGWSNIARDGSPHACLSGGGVVTDLKTLGGSGSYAYAINDAGQIVGTSNYQRQGSFDPNHAVLWQNGKINDLNKQLPRGSSWVLESAYDINGTGKIVGSGSIGGQHHAFLMVPGGALQAQSVAVSQGYNTGATRFAANAFFAVLTADEEATRIGSSIFGPGRPKR
jgi:probable HAF family extracellular repeat protein